MRRSTAKVLLAMLLTLPLVTMADRKADVEALAKKCDAAREARIKPLREAEIARCKKEKPDDDGYCERFFSDYGHASKAPNGTMKPRMFEDLPECVAAEAARRELALNP